MKKQNNLILGAVLALIAVIFVVMNTAPVTINFGFYQVKLPLIVVLVVMFIIGMVVSWFLGLNKDDKHKLSKFTGKKH